MTVNKLNRIRELFKIHGPVVRSGMLREHKIYSRDIIELIDNGVIKKLKSGCYVYNEISSDISDIETVAMLIPFGIICLQSAACYHELTLINPPAVSLAIPANRTMLALPVYPPVNPVAYPMLTFELGMIKSGNNVRIYDRERTICDFFRKRRQLGEDIALDILQTYMRGTRNLQKLFDYAGELRVKNVMKPYVEALV